MILDLFAGPGGWDVGAGRLGLHPLGIEMDDAACQTRRAARLDTEQGDVSTWLNVSGTGTLDGLIASPPCQTFSMAGKGAGRVALEQVILGIKRVACGEPIPYDEYDDIRTGLVLEPLRYALELEPDWIAWEQVPTVQPVWDACAEVLREDGYSVWTGHLHAEQYGVPQTRKRSVLIASRSREMSKPPATHSRFYPRNPQKLDEGVQKWVSMAEALGWGMTQRPSMTVTGGGTAAGGAEPFGNAARQGMVREIDAGRWRFAGAGQTSEQTAGQIPRDLDMPAHTITGKATAAWVLRNNTSANAAVRHQDEPAPTLYFGQRMNGVYWEPVPAIEGDTQDDVQWVYDRPPPTIVGSFHPDIVAAPGYRTTVSRQNAKGSVRVTVQEAAVLQTWQIKTPWFELPPPIIRRRDPATCPHAVLDEVVGVPWGFEDCVTCGERFPMRSDDEGWDEP